jgi:hypothetical protein
MMLIDRPRSCFVALCLSACALAAPATAGAQSLPFGLGFGLICGLGHSEPVPLQVEENGPLRLASMNATTRILADTDFDGATSVQQTVSLRLFDLQGNLEWKAGPFVLKSFEFASSLNFPGFDGVTPAPGALPDTSSHLAVFPPFGTECNGVGVAVHNGQRYVIMTMGTVASAGTAEAPQDLSKVILYVFNASNGNLVRKHKVVPRDGWFLSGFGGPAVLDADGDGNSEVVVARVRGLSNNRAEFLYESFNLVTGNREQRTRIVQKDKEANENPEFGGQDAPLSSE